MLALFDLGCIYFGFWLRGKVDKFLKENVL